MLRTAILIGVLAAGSIATAQIKVGPNVQVSTARANIPHREVVIAADPNNAKRLIACSMLNGPDKAVNTAAYVSFDGGLTWAAPVLADEVFADDPTCAYGPDGTVYFIAKTETRYPRSSIPAGSDSDAIYIRRSRDGGKKWDPVIHGILANDRPFMAIDNTHGPNRGRLYVAFDEHIHGEKAAHSNDDFRHTVRLATYVENGSTLQYVYDRAMMDQGGGITASPNVGSTVVLSDGTVVVLMAHMLGSKQATPNGKLHEDKTWLEVFLSNDGGITLEPAAKVADVKGTYNMMSSRAVTGNMAADPSNGAFKDRLYVVWADIRTGRSRIFFSCSSDKGATWPEPKPIDDNADRASGGPDDFMPEVAVNKDGVVGVQWYDRRDNPDNHGYYARFAASRDGGQTWLPSVRVSEQPNAVPQASKPGEFHETGGDTAGLTGDANGVFHSLWIDNRTGVQQVWTAPIRVN